MDFTILVTFALLAIFLSPVAGTLIVRPRDTDVRVNQSTYFNCSTDLSTAIFWYHGDIKQVYAVQGILEPYNERFAIDRSEWNGTNIYNLIIHSVQPGDAGQYICADDEGVGDKYSVQLVVLVADPICRSNIEQDKVIGQNTCNVKPDEVEISCIVTYHGNIHPQLEWKDGDDIRISEGLSNVTSGNNYSYILKLKGDISLDKSSYVCQTTRIAHEPRRCISEVINVLYAIGDNSTTNRRIDEEIICHANTTQSCNYQWRWFHNNDVTTESSSAILIPRKSGLHKCEAECSLRNETCNLLVMSVVVSESAESTQAKNASISVSVVVPVVLTLVLIAVLLGLFVFRRRWIARYGNKDSNVQVALLPKQNIGSAAAWSYFHGYLRIVLPDFKKRLIENTLNQDLVIVPKTVQKMLIIMPDSCICDKSLEVPKKIVSTGKSVVVVPGLTGNQQRNYKSSLYKLIDHAKDEEYYFVGEFATPLVTMYETCTSALCGMTKKQLYAERDSFDFTLRAILRHSDNTKCIDQFKLLKWSDPKTKKPNQSDIYNFLLPELRKEIKLQRTQKVNGENSSHITDEEESDPLKGHAGHPESEINVQSAALPKEAIGRSSALGYFYGYLHLVLPGFKKHLIKTTLKNYQYLVPKTVRKMLIIMPDSCNCAKSLEVSNKIVSTGKFVVLVANRAGNQQREYKIVLYKLIDHHENCEYYFAGEVATPLLTMHETCTSARMTKKQLYDERNAFYSTLEAILNHPNNAKCNNQFKLLKWSDPATKKPDQLDSEKPNQLDSEKPNQWNSENPNQLDSEKPNQLDSDKSNQWNSENPNQLDSDKPNQLDSDKPNQLDSDKPDQLDSDKPNQLDSKKPNQLDSEKPNQLDSDKPNQLDSDKPNQLDIYNFLLMELRNEIKLQQISAGRLKKKVNFFGQNKKNPSNIGADNNAPRSSNTLELLPTT